MQASTDDKARIDNIFIINLLSFFFLCPQGSLKISKQFHDLASVSDYL